MTGSVTIPDSDRYVKSTPSVLTADFAITFPVYEDPTSGEVYLRVFVDGTELPTSAWTFVGTAVSGLSYVYSGGTLTLDDAISGVELIVVSDRSPHRTSDFIKDSNLSTDVLDQILNKMIVSMRDMDLQLKHAIKFPLSDTGIGTDRVIPQPTLGTQYVVLIDTAGDLALQEYADPDADAAVSAAEALASATAAAASAAAAALSEAAAASSIMWTGTDTGSAGAYAITPSSPPGSYSLGQIYYFFAANANGGASTLDVNSLGAKAIQKDGAALTGGEIGAGDVVWVIYDGTQFQLLNNPRYNNFNVLLVNGKSVVHADWANTTAFDMTSMDPTADGFWAYDGSETEPRKVLTQDAVLPEVEVTAAATLGFAHANKWIKANKATGFALTIPANATTAFKIGTVIQIYQAGAGQVTISAAGGVTLRQPNGNKTAQQYSACAIRKVGTDEWVALGDLST